MGIEDELKRLILSKYKSMADFAEETGIKYQTVMSIFSRGIGNANVQNIIKICRVLGLSTDELAEGKIVFINPAANPNTAAFAAESFLQQLRQATLDGEPLTESEQQYIRDIVEISFEMIKRKRK